MRDPEFIELRNRFLIGLIVSLFIGVLLFLFFYNSYNFHDRDVYNEITDSDKIIVFVEDNDCLKCENLKNTLEISKYKYIVYNRDEDNYRKEIDLLLDIKYYDIDVPGLVYLEKGKVIAFISNIDNNSDLKDFIKRYGVIK